MTEREWLDSSDPVNMFLRLQGKLPAAGWSPAVQIGPRLASDRKLRLFACAVFRANQGGTWLADSLHALRTAEQYADGLIPLETLAFERNRIDPDLLAEHLLRDDADEALRHILAHHGHDRERQAYLLREIVGNPFVVVPICGDLGGYPVQHSRGIIGCQWCDAIRANPAVNAVANGIYDQRDWASLPILADALEDAGCGDHWGKGPHPILAHLRSRHPHALGCWAIDLILGSE